MCDFPAYVHHTHAWCPQRWEKSTKSPENGNTTWMLESELRSFARATNILNRWGSPLSKFLRIVKYYFLTNLWSSFVCLFSFVCSGLAKLKVCVHKTIPHFPLLDLGTARSLSVSITKTGLAHTQDRTEIVLLSLSSLSSGSSIVSHTSKYLSTVELNSVLLWCICWTVSFFNHQWNLDYFYLLATTAYPVSIHGTKITKYIISKYN